MRTTLFGLVVLPILAAQAEAANTNYGVVAFKNDTNIVIHYEFRWGKGAWESFSVAPGASHWHSWTYDYPGENSSPVPQIRFDYDLSSDTAFHNYRLKAYASPVTGSRYAKIYTFRAYDGDLHLTGSN